MVSGGVCGAAGRLARMRPPMKYDEDYRSDYVDDRRGASGGGRGGGGGIGMLIGLFRRFGIGGVIAGIAVLGAMRYCGGGGLGLSSGAGGETKEVGDDALKALVSVVLDDAQSVWQTEFKAMGKDYPMARLQLFTDSVSSACGSASASTGPFYCPGDQQVYIDLGFYQLLRDRLGAPGDFAQAYVIAHEIGHHVQNELGALEHRGEGAKGGSVRVELQADCYAGIWAHHSKNSELLRIEEGDLEEALAAAAAIGDDALQKGAGATVRPESFTHGSSDQRMRWFKVGFDSGEVARCDTFAASRL